MVGNLGLPLSIIPQSCKAVISMKHSCVLQEAFHEEIVFSLESKSEFCSFLMRHFPTVSL